MCVDVLGIEVRHPSLPGKHVTWNTVPSRLPVGLL